MTDQQLPDRNGDVIDDIVIALTRRGDLSDEHHAFYSEIVHRFEGLAADRDRLRTAWESARRRARQQRDALREAMIAETDRARRARDRYRNERNTARAELADARRWGRILEAQRADLRRELRAARKRKAVEA